MRVANPYIKYSIYGGIFTIQSLLVRQHQFALLPPEFLRLQPLLYQQPLFVSVRRRKRGVTVLLMH